MEQPEQLRSSSSAVPPESVPVDDEPPPDAVPPEESEGCVHSRQSYSTTVGGVPLL